MDGKLHHPKAGSDAVEGFAGKTLATEFCGVEEGVGIRRAGEVQAELGESAELIEEGSSESAEVRVCLADLGEIMPAQMTERR